jgi:hypothetical protein
MEEQAPYVVAKATIPAVLAPYVAVLQAEGFQVENWAPRSYPSLYSTWQPTPLVFYFCDLVVVEGAVHAWLVHKRADAPAFRLFHWMRVDAPEELRWLLQRNVHVTQARATQATEAATPAPFSEIPGATRSPTLHQEFLPSHRCPAGSAVVHTASD